MYIIISHHLIIFRGGVLRVYGSVLL